jgi:NAD/NADP transhydrogenase beta subunit
MMLDDAQSIIIIPGYGLAVSQAQYILHTVENALMRKELASVTQYILLRGVCQNI